MSRTFAGTWPITDARPASFPASGQGLEGHDVDLELIDGPVLEAAAELAAVVLVEARGQRRRGTGRRLRRWIGPAMSAVTSSRQVSSRASTISSSD